MAFDIGKVRGMQDVLPPDGDLWLKVESVMRSSALSYGFSYARTPILEFTELFDRSAGTSSDVVQKEMYTFNDKSGRSVTMRPEFTAGVLRAVASNVATTVYPMKLMYFGPCYRYEKPQSGRYREFFQFGVEIFGAKSILADLEVLCLARKIFSDLDIDNFRLEINAIGCSNCKKSYIDEVKLFFKEKFDNLCETCQNRLNLNPLRIFDCKNFNCQNLFSNAPRTIDFICDDCKNNFEDLQNFLGKLNIPFVVNPRIVRGLDYYSKFVFEFIVDFDGKDLTVCGGGRYDGLSRSLGGPDLPAVGFGIGVERIIELLKKKTDFGEISKKLHIYIACADSSASPLSLEILYSLRSRGVMADCDIVGRSLKSQMKYANKIGYEYVVVLGNNEILSNTVNLKSMRSGQLRPFSLSNFVDDFCSYLFNIK